ncbi:hypothetical protein LJC10_01610 [Selenomonadales bacterium OttesenSCG-928-I06]|nr:hypothetical protein [Selenomonadales bacterium OttesenSCG-928-I06]
MLNLSKKHLLLIVFINLCVLFIFPSIAVADFSFKINFISENDGWLTSEIWYDNELFWRGTILPDGVKPVFGGFKDSKTTFFIPDIVNGMFVIKVE